MLLLAEVVVEEWLKRRGYFTIRGVKLGNDEMDILAIRQLSNGNIERRHIEVSASTNPLVLYPNPFAKLPAEP
jgi:hypothetical protein